MPKYNCSYAYDVPHYFDFTVEAESEDAARAAIEKALEDGHFSSVVGKPFLENLHSDRVFTSGAPAADGRAPHITSLDDAGISEAARA